MNFEDIPSSIADCITAVQAEFQSFKNEIIRYGHAQLKHFGAPVVTTIKGPRFEALTKPLRKEKLDDEKYDRDQKDLINVEPLSAPNYQDEAVLSCTYKKEKVGLTVTTQSTGPSRPEAKDAIHFFKDVIKLKLGKTGGVYGKKPNKKYFKIPKILEALAQGAPVSKIYGSKFFQERVAYILEIYTGLSLYYMKMQAVAKSEDAFVKGNENAGTGWKRHGKKFRRRELPLAMKDPTFTSQALGHFLGMQAAYWFGFSTFTPIEIRTTAPDFRGVRAARSDAETLSMDLNNGILSTVVEAKTRKVAGDGTGLFKNAQFETSFFKSSVNVMIMEAIPKLPGYHFPWELDVARRLMRIPPIKTARKLGFKRGIIPIDFGLSFNEITSGADQIYGFWIGIQTPIFYSAATISGTSITTINYRAAQEWILVTARQIDPNAEMIANGDDIFLVIAVEFEELVMEAIFPVGKRKSEIENGMRAWGGIVYYPSTTELIKLIPARAQKEESSAAQSVQMTAQSTNLTLDKTRFYLNVSDEAREQVDTVYDLFKTPFLFQGPVEDTIARATDIKYLKMMSKITKANWTRALLKEDDQLPEEATGVPDDDELDE